MEVVGAYLGLERDSALFASFRQHDAHFCPVRGLTRLPILPCCDVSLTSPGHFETASRHACALMSMAKTSDAYPSP